MKEQDIFMNAPTGVTREELAAYLDEACSHDPELRLEVEKLLDECMVADGLLDAETLAQVPMNLSRRLRPWANRAGSLRKP